MQRIHTHYDNLKVARNAPLNVIRAAYKTLSQQYHPDRNPDNAEAARIMTLINTAYAVLSDADKRENYDQFLARQEEELFMAEMLRRQQNERTKPPQTEVPPPTREEPPPRRETASGQSAATRTKESPTEKSRSHFSYYAPLYLLILVPLFISLVKTCKPTSKAAPRATWETAPANKAPSPDPAPEPITVAQKPFEGPTIYDPGTGTFVAKKDKYERPLIAPNGLPWPTTAGYVQGYEILYTNGLSTVTVDNTLNNSDVFVKLKRTGSASLSVRTFFIPAHQQFTVNTIDAGVYDVRYRDLDSGALAKSEPFTLKEEPTLEGIRYSTIKMTLYKVANGNMRTAAISENEF